MVSFGRRNAHAASRSEPCTHPDILLWPMKLIIHSTIPPFTLLSIPRPNETNETNHPFDHSTMKPIKPPYPSSLALCVLYINSLFGLVQGGDHVVKVGWRRHEHGLHGCVIAAKLGEARVGRRKVERTRHSGFVVCPV